MNYRHVYMLIIEHAKSEQKLGLRKKGNGNYYEAHHILPKSLFPLWKNRQSNYVLLTAREHFFCHQLLEKIYPNSNMFLALWWLANDDQNKYIIKGSKEYEKIKKEVSEKLKKAYKGKHLNKVSFKDFSDEKKAEIGKKISEKLSGRKLSDKHKENLRKAIENKVYIRKHTDEEKKKISESSKGRKWYTNGEINKFCKEAPEGFNLGRVYINHTNNGKKWYTNGEINIMAEKCPEGFWPGRKMK